MKRTVGVMTVAVMLCAQTGAYAADQMSKERESSKQSGQAGQDMQKQSGQTSQSGQSGQSGQTGLSYSEEMQRQNQQIWQSGKQAQALCQRPAQAKQASAQPDQGKASSQPDPAKTASSSPQGQAQASKDQSQPIPEQGKHQAQAGHDQDKQTVQDQGRGSGGTQTIKGQYVRMESDFYVIKDQSGKETCVPTSYGTFVDQTFSPGDTVVARLGQDGNALVIGRPRDNQTASSNPQGQDMNQGAGDQRGDRGFTGSQPGSQAQDSGPRDQSMKSADKGLSGSQPGSQSQDSATRDQSKEKGLAGNQQAASVVKGELLKIQGEFYTVKDQSGSEVRLHVNKDTKMDGAVNVGDKIEAERTSADHAISIKKAQDAGASRNR